ncbi:DUF971 domain-containing protein [Rhodoferax saidenbachensis]|uniref:DUF971 family protein n=1 Tax=Rhodoferax saidenbachensis TaxID=1484693 RepID=A0ABU1ZNF6_9BURK|nr:DUF971 domain-containing protein [Rhodoferax saidenbachensis]MDR7307086.1 DUF971 family protein [Rhodoferax saidenbachensis]
MNMLPSAAHLSAQQLELQWAEDHHTLPAAYLRQQCHCTHCRRDGMAEALAHSSVGVTLTDATPVGQYGVQLHFSDGHNRGIYPWVYLRSLAQRLQVSAA